MKKTMIILLVAVLPLLSLSGCWNRQEVTDIAIIVALGIDKNEEDDFLVSVQVLNPGEVASSVGGGSGYDSPVTTYSADGKLLFEAMNKLTKQVPR
jgi:spore germination protein KC